MRVLVGINLAGVVAAAVYAGWVVGGGYVPTCASLSGLAFLIGVLLPFLGEHAELQRGLDRAEREFIAQRRRDLGLRRRELFTNRRSRPIWRRGRISPVPTALAAAAGVALLAADLAIYLRQIPPGGAAPISNF